MRISELEQRHARYGEFEVKIAGMLERRAFPEVFSVCERSFQDIVPAIKFRKKREIQPETPRLLALSVICQYGPPLFEHAVLESLLEFVKSNRLLAKHENGYLEQAENALRREAVAHAVWNHVEGQAGALQRDLRKELGVDQQAAVGIVEVWEELGVICRVPEGHSYRLYFRTRLDAETEGMCPACGVRGKGRKELFFKGTACKNCGAEGYYHISFANPE